MEEGRDPALMSVDPQALSFPLTAEHARQLDELVKTLSRDEALYISGYLAGLARRQPEIEKAAPASQKPLTILYGSETGHAAGLAQALEDGARARGLTVRLADMADFRLQDLKGVKHLAVLTSTHGDGDPPDPAVGFVESLMGRRAPRLNGAVFAVLGLGDRSYEHYCAAAKAIDGRLEELGARRLRPLAECDVDYHEPAGQWIDDVLSAFTAEMGQASAVYVTGPGPVAAPGATMGAKTGRPFLAPILETLVLNGRGSDKVTRHIEFSLAGSGLTYEPGDSLAVLPQNDPDLVAEVMDTLDLAADATVPDSSGDVPLAEALARQYEVTTLTPRFLEPYAEAAGAERLRHLLRPENRAELTAYCADRQIIDVVAEFPVKGLDPAVFVGMLRHLTPRLYSLASSQAALPDEAHVTVAAVRYESHGRPRKGVASGYLAERRGLDDTVPVTIERNKNFRLPVDGATPIIMIGAGTGIAPFRAFLQEREASGATGGAWLFFGDRRFRTDFLYQVEWQRLLKEGRLSRMDVAFSRDQPKPIYVQHRMEERGRELFAWLAEGAHLYVCGDANGLAPDVHATLAGILAREGGTGAERAEEELKRMMRDKRYQRDVY